MVAQRMIVGHVEKVAIPSLKVDGVLAKVDTGAFSGALHCVNITLSEDGKTLYFQPLNKKTDRIKTTEFSRVFVRSTSGHKSARYTIQVTIFVQNKAYTTTIGLTNRSTMGYDMLLGRRFLRENAMLVDVLRNGEYDKEWGRLE